MKTKPHFVLLFLLFLGTAQAAPNLVLITIDGLRWQELFHGADPDLIEDKNFVKDPEALKKHYWDEDPDKRKRLLMPFTWEKIANNGVILGNRLENSFVSVKNEWYFSYPGYNEIFTGYADPGINSNKKFPNPNITFLEWLNNKEYYQSKLGAFGSWDVFPFIFNRERSKLHINAGFEKAGGYPVSDKIQYLNTIQNETPSPWENVRLDVFTYHFALDYLKIVQPIVMTISFGETDDFAHDGRYDQYLDSAHRTDYFIRSLWTNLQKLPAYKDNTILIVTTDHGRGSTPADWQHHASKKATQGYLKSLKKFPDGIVGSNHVWVMAMGKNIPETGETQTRTELYQTQIVPTILTLLEENPSDFNSNLDPVIKQLIKTGQ